MVHLQVLLYGHSFNLLNASYMLAINKEWVPVQMCILLTMHDLFIIEQFVSVENLDSNLIFKTHKNDFSSKRETKFAI